MRLHQSRLLFRRRLLQHEVEFVRPVAINHKHAVVRDLFRRGPKAVADDVGFRQLLQRLRCAEQYVAAGYECMDMAWRLFQHFFIEWHLQIEERLIDPLPSGPAKHGYRRERFSARRVSRQSPALPTGVE